MGLERTGHSPRQTKFFEQLAEKRAIPGIISLTASRQVLYMNAEAQALSRHLFHAACDKHSESPALMLPQEILEVCDALQQIHLAQIEPKDQDNLHLRRVVGKAEFPILIRGFLIPSQEQQEARFLILMEKFGRRGQVISEEAKKFFQLTDREHEIVKHVADGLTNKEIAEALEISEHTVKEHIKHILRKTNSTTRTGILAQILRHA
ncbi:MAG: LuxR family transcriptional regulator [Nitrospirae bacterium]|nr:MAG: LuxR family transcriptional regulator [Nitrospirota bacterium]